MTEDDVKKLNPQRHAARSVVNNQTSLHLKNNLRKNLKALLHYEHGNHLLENGSTAAKAIMQTFQNTFAL